MIKDNHQKSLKALKGHSKRLINSLASKFGKSTVFEITQMERIASSSILGFPNKQINIARQWIHWGFQETLIGWSLAIFVGLYLIVQIFGQDVGAENLWTEFWGLIFDVLIILVGFGFIQNWKQKREDITRQHEQIEDFRRWDSEEARHRILGAIRRLNRRGITQVDLTGCVLRDVNFKQNGVSSIFGSKLSGGNWADEVLKTSIFENVGFSRLDCREVQFEQTTSINGHTIGPTAHFKNCDFWDADLQLSIFDGASLIWDEPAPDDMYETVDENPDGSPARVKVVAGRFNEANLAHTSFRGCDFLNADFRDAYCIEYAHFQGATGLETCLFDDDEIKVKVLAQSKEQMHD